MAKAFRKPQGIRSNHEHYCYICKEIQKLTLRSVMQLFLVKGKDIHVEDTCWCCSVCGLAFRTIEEHEKLIKRVYDNYDDVCLADLTIEQARKEIKRLQKLLETS